MRFQRWLYVFPLRLRSVFRPARVEDELNEEIQFHLDQLIEEGLARGLSRADARRAALRALDGIEQRKERCRDARGITLVTDLVRDVKYAFRVLRRAPSFTFVAIVSLALGTGANIAVFQLIDALRLRPLPVDDPGRLAIVRISDFSGSSGQFSSRYPDFSYAQWDRLRRDQQAFDGMLAWSHSTFDLSTRGESRFVENGLWVSGSFFTVLGVRPAAGRLFIEADDVRGCGAPGVVLSHAFWSREFGRDPAAVGRSLSVNGHQFAILGVTPAAFHGVEVGRSFDIALPLCAEPLVNGEDSRIDRAWSWWLGVMGRLKPGWTLAQASAHVAALSPELYRSTLPSGFSADATASYLAFRLATMPGEAGFSALRLEYDRALRLLLAIAGVVLLIACANLGNLLLARVSARQREVAARLALGASRGRIIRQLLVESLVLAVSGATAGALLAPALCGTVVRIMSAAVDPVFIDVALDWRVLAFVVSLAIATCVLFGLAPALGGTRLTLDEALRSGGRSMTAPHGAQRMRRVLVVAQVALSLVLLIGGLLFARSLVNLLTVDAGFRQRGILEIDVDLTRLRLEPAARRAIRDAVLERIRHIPGVDSAASAMSIPLVNDWSQTVYLDEQARERRGLSYFNGITPGYFSTLDIPIVRGRDVDSRDTPQSPRVAVVNERFVERFFGHADPIGRTFRVEEGHGVPERAIQIVGVVRNTKYASLREPFKPIVYLAQQSPAPGEFDNVLIRTAQPLASITTAVKQAVEALNPAIAFHFHDFQEQIRYSLRQDRLLAVLCGFFAALAVLLATVGVYGVMAYAVTRRTNEIGVRMALGATGGTIRRMMLAEASRLLAIGLGIGALLVPIAARAAASLLFGLQPTDRATTVAAVLLLGTAVAVSSYLPARRASRLDPLVALRHE